MTRDETFAAYNKCQTKERLICGGLRSGKTYLAAHTVLSHIATLVPAVIAVVATDERTVALAYKILNYLARDRFYFGIDNAIRWLDKVRRVPEFMQLRNGTEIHFFTSSETWPFDVDVLWLDNEVTYSGLGLLAEWRSTVKEDGLFIWSQWDWTNTQESRELWLSHPESQFVLSTLDNPGLSAERIAQLRNYWVDSLDRLAGKHP